MARSSSSIAAAALSSLLLLLLLLQVNAQQQRRTQAMQVDALRNEYLSLEQALWQYLRKTANSQNNRETQLRKVYDSHWDFIHLPLMNRRFDSKIYSTVLRHYEWTLLEMKLTELNNLFDFYKVGSSVREIERSSRQRPVLYPLLSPSSSQNILMKPKTSQDLEERAVLDLTDQVLRNDKTFSMSQIFQEIEAVMVKQTMYYRAMLVSVCVCVYLLCLCMNFARWFA